MDQYFTNFEHVILEFVTKDKKLSGMVFVNNDVQYVQFNKTIPLKNTCFLQQRNYLLQLMHKPWQTQ